MNAPGRQPLWLRILLPLFALYALVGYLVVPWALMQVAPDRVASALDARLEMGDIHFDPFRLRLVILEPRLTGPLDNAGFTPENVVTADRIEARLLVRSLRELAPVIAIEIDAPTLHVERAEDGTINLTALRRSSADSEPAPTTFGLQRLLVNAGQLTVVDRSRPQPFATSAEAVGLDLRELWLPAGEPGPFWLGLRIEGAALDLRGQLSATPEFDLTVTLVDLPLALAERWLAGGGPADRLRGSLHGSGRLTLQQGGVPRLADGQLQVHGLDVRLPADLAMAGTHLQARMRALRVNAVTGDLWPVDLDLGHLGLHQGQVSIEHRSVEPSAPAAADAGAPADRGPPQFALRLAEFSAVDIDVAATDANLAIPATLDVGLRRVSAEGLHWPANPGQSATVTVDAALAPHGESSFVGNLDLAAGRLQGRLDTTRLPLPAFAPWVHAFTRLGLASGELGHQADLDLQWASEPMNLRLLLDGWIEDLAMADPDGIDLIGWERLDVSSLDLDLTARRLAIGEVTVRAPDFRFARLADGSTNLAGIGLAIEDPSEAATLPAPTRESGPAWHWELGRFNLDAGTLNFIDETLVIPFATRVEALEGSASDLTSNADSRAQLRLDGRIPPTGSAHIEARGLAMAPLADTDLTLDFRGVPMPRMSPWIGTFAGYRVAGGRLDLDLAYRIDQGALVASNKVTVNAMRLGERVDSPRAMDLPLRLALALLRDSDDNVILEVPVSGNVDDPQFDLRPVILRAIRNVLTNIVAAPFRLLAGLVGGSGDEQLDRVVYALGSADLGDEQEAQLLILERALGQRPALGLQLASVHAGEADRDALRVAALERDLAEHSADRDAALEFLFRERHGDEQFEALEAVHRSAMPAPDSSPDGPASEAEASDSRGGTSSGTGTLLIELENHLLHGINVSNDELHTLARRRAEAVYLYLTDAGLDRERIRIDAEPTEVELTADQVPLRFELDALDP
ncbi:MAG: DUF748 domain-containing protein [Gammaproteobacteria bacterium]|nr:DUF748 domain-containing protein [Gammaproteobacteria bacterium]